jgi:hypothetical protein
LTCSYAAKRGHLEVLQWARANGCPWDEETCTFAAKKGHNEVLQWAIENGCPEPLHYSSDVSSEYEYSESESESSDDSELE